MPAGDLVTADYMGELRATALGDTTVYSFATRNPVTGLGVPRVKDNDLPFAHKDGSYGGQDKSDQRVITVAFDLWDSPAVALGALKQLHTIWALSSVDLALYLRLPGFGKFYVNGRPRGLTDDIDIFSPDACRIAALGTFVTTTDHALHYV